MNTRECKILMKIAGLLPASLHMTLGTLLPEPAFMRVFVTKSAILGRQIREDKLTLFMMRWLWELLRSGLMTFYTLHTGVLTL